MCARPSVKPLACLGVAPLLLALTVTPARSQSNRSLSAFFAAQGQSVQALIVQGVEQAISGLPPAAPQGAAWSLDPTLQTWVRSDLLGPQAFLSSRTIGAGEVGIAAALSYFELERTIAVTNFEVDFADDNDRYLGSFGLEASARVGVLSLGATYGLGPTTDLEAVVPITVVDASAQTVFLATSSDGEPFAATGFRRRGRDLTAEEAIGFYLDEGSLFHARETPPGFDEGTHVGLGRIRLGLKHALLTDERFGLALGFSVALPSPSHDEFAGSDTFAMLPRVIAELPIGGNVVLRGDIGYEADIDTASLSRLAWDAGLSFTARESAVDLGIRGSRYDEGIKWAPERFQPAPEALRGGPSYVVTSPSGTDLGNDLVDFVAALRLRLGEAVSVSLVASAPLTEDGLRADATGTLAVDAVW